MKKTYLSSSIDKFYDRTLVINDVVRAGEAVVVAIYGGDESEDLNDYKYKCIAKSIKRKVSMLASISSTKASMEQHLKRVFLKRTTI